MKYYRVYGPTWVVVWDEATNMRVNRRSIPDGARPLLTDRSSIDAAMYDLERGRRVEALGRDWIVDAPRKVDAREMAVMAAAVRK